MLGLVEGIDRVGEGVDKGRFRLFRGRLGSPVGGEGGRIGMGAMAL